MIKNITQVTVDVILMKKNSDQRKNGILINVNGSAKKQENIQRRIMLEILAHVLVNVRKYSRLLNI